MNSRLRRIAQSEVFQSFILLVILINGVAMGLETFPAVNDRYDRLFFFLLVASQCVFVVEIAIRLFAYSPKLGEFFHGFWNSFDFTVVLASLLPAIGPFATVARLCRLLRVARIISVSDELRGTLYRGGVLSRVLAAMFLAAIWLYIFAVAGVYLFGELDPERWSTVAESARTILNGLTFGAIPLFSYGIGGLIFWVLLALILVGCLMLVFLPSRVVPLLMRLEEAE